MEDALTAAGFEDMKITVTSKGGYTAAFINAEKPQYLVIEDRFPNGRPPLEKAGVYMTDRDTVNNMERMKVTTCLNPLHTVLAVYGCLLGYDTIANEMKDPELKALIEKVGYDEGMPVVVDPKIVKPIDFIHEVIDQRFPNPFMPDTPQRIALDTSQKVGIRFGETIKAYAARPDLDVTSLTYIPLAIAGWLRYLLAVDDEGKPMECSSDPMLSALQEQLTGVKLGENGSARALIRASNVRALCTTDDPADDLQYHRLLAADTSFDVRVLPTFRPEKALNIADPGYPAYLKKLGEAAGIFIHTIDDVKQALALRAEFFAQAGCRLSDHSFGSPDFTVWDEDAAGKAVIRALNGETLTGHEVSAYQSLMMDFLGELYCDKGFGMQLHLGAQRNLSGRLYRSLGADVGGDAIGDTISAGSLAALLDRLAARDKLPKTILYTLNAADNDKLIAAAGCFQDESAPGKVQFGSAWWFNDHFDGMTAQMKSLANIGVLSRFIGMLTDSRSFLSYPRHEYFRRVLCELVGSWIEKGMAPADYDAIGGMIEDICFNNAWSYMGI